MKMAKCISNEEYLTSLTVGQEYVILEDSPAKNNGFICIVDNTQESYFYPINMFEIIK